MALADALIRCAAARGQCAGTEIPGGAGSFSMWETRGKYMQVGRKSHGRMRAHRWFRRAVRTVRARRYYVVDVGSAMQEQLRKSVTATR